MRKTVDSILYGFVILAGIVLTAWGLNYFFGAVLAAIYAVMSIISMVSCLYEMYRAPLMTDEDPSTKNQ